VYREQHAGFYARHRDQDELAFILEWGAVPWALGARQRHLEPFEQADLTLSGEKIALSVSGQGTGLDGATGLRCDAAANRLTLQTGDRANRVEVAGGPGTVQVHAGQGAAVSVADHDQVKVSANLVTVGHQGQVKVDGESVKLMDNATVKTGETTIQKQVKVQSDLTVG
jgi:hypothetical protein